MSWKNVQQEMCHFQKVGVYSQTILTYQVKSKKKRKTV